MGEEESLLRALAGVDGDDLARSAYADWLEERGDARAAYLRAETGWARPWREGVRPEVDLTLATWARDFDPVWVARVSRPPLGVCCDHLRFHDAGPELTREEIAAFEVRMGVRLPPEYIAFLLVTNGGEPEAVGPWRKEAEVLCAAESDFWLLGLTPSEGRPSCPTLEQVIPSYRDRYVPFVLAEAAAGGDVGLAWYRDCIPIRPRSDGYFTPLLVVDGVDAGMVRGMDWHREPLPTLGYQPQPQRQFAQYLARLVPAIPCDIPEQERFRTDDHPGEPTSRPPGEQNDIPF